MTIKFTSEYQYPNGDMQQRTSVEIPQDSSLITVVEAFEQFLKGAGYMYDGHLDIIHDADSTSYDTELDGWATDNETVFGSHYSESEDVIKQEANKCIRCGLTREQLGHHKCYDDYCGMK